MKSMSSIPSVFCACLLACGCQRQNNAESVAVEAVRVKFRHVQDCLGKGRTGVDSIHALGSQICGWMACVSNATLRAELAMEFSEMVLAVDLKGIPYFSASDDGRRLQREFATYFFLDYVKALRLAMTESGCQPDVVMDFYFRAMHKFKDACFSIPYKFKMLPGENTDQFSARVDAAIKLQGLYEQTMSEVRRFMLPRLSEYFPPELHDEFRKRIEPFFDFPSRKEFYEMMHPGYKYPLPSSSKPPAKKETPKNLEDVVEVDI